MCLFPYEYKHMTVSFAATSAELANSDLQANIFFPPRTAGTKTDSTSTSQERSSAGIRRTVYNAATETWLHLTGDCAMTLAHVYEHCSLSETPTEIATRVQIVVISPSELDILTVSGCFYEVASF
ncbi:uncharacterized protein BDR25DRAFT_35834 [Lindgomyces ingoldianus]|uniref:Uncharacterized protein n=1 Tax=Lindgomyces ingoldianus TaxID=673940 RepID=A0ACB6QSH5_9PLEO|nr:uncharacterized protein BDR25DRAFT_35834 [Lindgomyces ingoldianus]KAF2469969.1 hypothetical protein BDR25DRAFT_35834 [Lindgomyces ingoldianus]